MSDGAPPERDRIFIEDIRASGHCVRGARAWFTSMGIDFSTVLREGVTVARLRALKDGLADQVVRRTLDRDKSKG